MAIGTEYTLQPESAAGESSSPEDAQNKRGARYYTPERLPHILHAVAGHIIGIPRSAARAARPADIAAEDIRAAAADSKSPRRRAAAGEKKSPAEIIPTGRSC